MPAFTHDDRFVDPDEVRAPNVAAVLLVDLGVLEQPKDVQRRAVATWLEVNDPSPALLRSLRQAELLAARSSTAGRTGTKRRKKQRKRLRPSAVTARVADLVEIRHRRPDGRVEVTVGVVEQSVPIPGGRTVLTVRPADGDGPRRMFRVPSTRVGRVRVLERSNG